jgi:hypothetical protein
LYRFEFEYFPKGCTVSVGFIVEKKKWPDTNKQSKELINYWAKII